MPLGGSEERLQGTSSSRPMLFRRFPGCLSVSAPPKRKKDTRKRFVKMFGSVADAVRHLLVNRVVCEDKVAEFVLQVPW